MSTRKINNATSHSSRSRASVVSDISSADVNSAIRTARQHNLPYTADGEVIHAMFRSVLCRKALRATRCTPRTTATSTRIVESFIENFNRHAIKVDQHLTADQWLASAGARPGTADGLYAAYATYVTAFGHAESRGMLSPDDFKAWFQTASHRQRPVDPDRVRSTLRDILQYKASDGLPPVVQRRQTATLRSLSAAPRHATTKASRKIFEVAAKAAPTDSPLENVLERENAFLDSLFKTHHNVGGTDSNEENRDKYPFVYWSVMLFNMFIGASRAFIVNSVFLIIIYFIRPKRLRKPNDKKIFMLISVIITLIGKTFDMEYHTIWMRILGLGYE